MAPSLDHVHHFDMGTWLLFFAYFISVVGCTIGLACTLQARHASGRARLTWQVLAAVSIGGVGIWLMHFLAMLGFTTPGMPVRYDIFRTWLSAFLSVSAVFIGLVVFGVGTRYARLRLVGGGLITGLAVNLMHYTGMLAVNVRGGITYDTGLVALSIVIAVVAATAALWFTASVDHFALRILAGVVMGIAVTGMHYTGMAAVRVQLDTAAPDPAGVDVFSFLFPVFVFAGLALAIPISAVLMASPTSPDPPAPAGEERKEPIASARS